MSEWLTVCPPPPESLKDFLHRGFSDSQELSVEKHALSS